MTSSIKRIHAPDLTIMKNGVTYWNEHPAMESIRRELFPETPQTEFLKKYFKYLSIDGQKFLKSPFEYQRGGEAYWISTDTEVVGVLILHFYKWETVAPQICFRAEIDYPEGKMMVKRLELTRFESLFNTNTSTKLLAELSSFWVHPQYRGQGYGKELFGKALEVFGTLLRDGDIGFTVARGALGKQQGQKIFHHLLDTEEKANGRDPITNLVKITGISVDTDILSRQLGFDCRYFPIHPDSLATVAMAGKSEMTFRGFFRTTGSIFGKLWN